MGGSLETCTAIPSEVAPVIASLWKIKVSDEYFSFF